MLKSILLRVPKTVIRKSLTKTSGRLLLVAMADGRRRPGEVRDAIIGFLRTKSGEASVADITAAVRSALHDDTVPSSSVRSYLNLNAGTVFRRGSRGQYRLID